MERIGELAAFGTAVCWTATAIFQALTPLFTTLFAWLILGETMRLARLAAMAVSGAGPFFLI